MGEGLTLRCPECGHESRLTIGIGFLSPANPEAVLSGEYGEKAKEDFEKHPGTGAFFENILYECRCGNLQSREVMFVFDHGGCVWDRSAKPYWNNGRCTCELCGKRMHRIRHCPRHPLCPRCGTEMEETDYILWD